VRVALALVALAGTARADGDYGYATLDRLDGHDTLGVSAGYFSIRGPQWMRFDLHGEAVGERGFGGYVAAPAVFESNDSGVTSQAFGGVEVGVEWAKVGPIIHLGVVLPTASVGTDALAPAMIARPTDYAQMIPNTTTVRLGMSFGFRSCFIFGRFDLGADAPIIADDSNGNVPGLLVRGGAAIGFDDGSYTVTFELSGVLTTGENSTDYEALATMLRFRTHGLARPYLAAIVPLDRTRSEPQSIVMAGIDFGGH
jgi:hypothetical protein